MNIHAERNDFAAELLSTATATAAKIIGNRSIPPVPLPLIGLRQQHVPPSAGSSNRPSNNHENVKENHNSRNEFAKTLLYKMRPR